MRLLLTLAAVITITVARPEKYRETEDFQFSRSSSDEGSKSGYYGAQRGNMGGNFERAHNMDSLAQHQMSGLVRQVDGELGQGANQRTGTVFSSANSRGMYGSGHYDLSHVQGRNFQEGASFDSAQSQSSALTSHSAGSMDQSHSSSQGYDSSNAFNSQYRGYNTARRGDNVLYTNNLQHNADDTQAAHQQGRRYESRDSGYNSQTGYNRQSVYNQANSDYSNGYGLNSQTRLVGTGMPVRVVLRPASRVTIPVAAQTYDANQASSSFDHNAINTEAEALSGNDEHTAYRPTNKAKSYESSYSYRKQWEKHDTQPIGVPLGIPTTPSPFPVNSELYEDTQAHNSERQQGASSVDTHNFNSRQNSFNVKSASSSQSSHQAGYNAQRHNAASSAGSGAYNAGDYNNGAALSQVLGNQVEDINSKPKGYQSSYSYHKSWERQGDPYVIIPVPGSSDIRPASQKLVTSNQGAYGTNQYGSHQRIGSQQRYLSNGDVDCDCDENGHIRVARSYNVQGLQQEQQQEDLTQQAQNKWENIEDLTQQTQNLEDLGQQTQHNWEHLEDLAQHTQNLELTQQNQNKWDKIEDLGQQTQSQWSPQELGQQTEQLGLKIEDLGQQSVNPWGQQEHKNNWNTLDLEPQSQTDTQQSLITEITIPTTQPMQNEETSNDYSPQNSGPNNWEIHITDTDKGTDVTSSLGYPTSQDVDNNEKNDERYKVLATQNTAKPIQDSWKLNNNKLNSVKPWQRIFESQQTQTNNFYGYNSNDKKLLNQDQQPNPWISNAFYNTQDNNYGHKWNTYTAEQSGQNKTTDYHSNDKFSDTKPLSSLWDKLDTIENQSNKTKGSDVFNIEYPFTSTINSKYGSTLNHSSDINENINGQQNENSLFITTSKSTTIKPIVKPINNSDFNERPQDIGRGDIGPEDTINIAATSERPLNIDPTNTNPNSKTTNYTHNNVLQTATETMRVQNNSHQNNAMQGSYFVSGLHKHDHNITNNTTEHTVNADAAEDGEILSKKQFADSKPNGIQPNGPELGQQHKEINLESLDQPLDVGQQAEIVGEEYFDQQGEIEHPNNFSQQSNTFQNQFSSFEHQASNFENTLKNHSNNFGIHLNNFEHSTGNINPQISNTNEPSPYFEQQSQTFEQQPPNFKQQLPNFEQHQSITEQQMPNFERHQSISEQQLPNYEQHPSIFDQQSKYSEHSTNAGQQTSNYQFHSHDFGQHFEQQSSSFEQNLPNFESHIPSFDQHLPNFEHSSNIDHHSSAFGQHLPNFEQHSLNFEQPTPNFGLPSPNFEHPIPNSGYQSPNFVQQPQSFEQNLPNFKQHSPSFSSNSKQHPPNFIEHSSHDHLLPNSGNAQQHLPNFSQQPENTEQQLESMDEQSFSIENQLDNFEQQLGIYEQQSVNFEPQDNVFYQEKVSPYINQEVKNQEGNVQLSEAVPLFNADGQWVQKNYDLQQFNTNKDLNVQPWSESPNTNLNQQMHQEWHGMEPLAHNQNVGLFSQIHDMPEKIDLQRSSDTMVPNNVAQVDPTPQPVTEKAEFWKSVTNKFVHAKDKVKSWFSSNKVNS